jgi:hypothetical protein
MRTSFSAITRMHARDRTEQDRVWKGAKSNRPTASSFDRRMQLSAASEGHWESDAATNVESLH